LQGGLAEANPPGGAFAALRKIVPTPLRSPLMAKSQKQAQSLAQTFRLLGDPTRLRILMVLGNGEHNVTHICRTLRMSQPTVSRHLSILKMSSIAEARRDGKEIYYSVPTPTRRVIKSLIERAEKIRQTR
jgi:ArsR family transcriptional regulator